MIVNSYYSAGREVERAKYTVTNDESNVFYPEEAYSGQYVLTTTGGFSGNPIVYDATGTYKIAQICVAYTIEDLPPKAREVLENFSHYMASRVAPPPSANIGYCYFVMPEENVKIVNNG